MARWVLLALQVLVMAASALAEPAPQEQATGQKTVYIPKVFRGEGADPSRPPDPLTRWSWERSYQSENFVVFWGPRFDGPPTEWADPRMRFEPKRITDLLESIYRRYVDEIGFCTDTSDTNLGRYKIIVVMNETWDERGPTGWAYGATYDNTIGAMWVHPSATRDGGVLSHELAHALQGMIAIQDNKVGGGYMHWEPGGSFWETHANFMRSQVYPQYAAEDSPRWMATAMYHWSSTRHHYAAFRLLWHMQRLDGIEMVNRLWKESLPNEHSLQTYRRLKGWTQAQLNDFVYDYAVREVTFDYPVNGFGRIVRNEYERMKQEEPRLLWRRYTILDAVDADGGRYVCPDAYAPQDYGLNLIPLHPTGGTVRVAFRGLTPAHDSAGWRYGFVTVGRDGEPVRYLPPGAAAEGGIEVTLRPEETALYLVVIGAPTEPTHYMWEPGWPKIKRYPYEIQVSGAVPEGHQESFRGECKRDGRSHPNGGGWVADTAQVAASVYVGPRAIVRGRSVITGEVRIDGTAWVEDATISGRVVIDGNANVYGGEYAGEAHITHNAILNRCKVSGRAVVRDNALLWNRTLGGDIVVGGDAEEASGDTGVYLQCPHRNNGRKANDGAGWDHPANQDINPKVICPGSAMAR